MNKNVVFVFLSLFCLAWQRVRGKRNPYTTVSVLPLWKSVWSLIEKLKMELPYDPAIPLGIYLKECKSA
jgi:hypothetical protein